MTPVDQQRNPQKNTDIVGYISTVFMGKSGLFRLEWKTIRLQGLFGFQLGKPLERGISQLCYCQLWQSCVLGYQFGQKALL